MMNLEETDTENKEAKCWILWMLVSEEILLTYFLIITTITPHISQKYSVIVKL